MQSTRNLFLSAATAREARKNYLQTLRTEGYSLHHQIFKRLKLIEEYITHVDNMIKGYNEQGIKVAHGTHEVNCMQKLFVDVVGLLDIVKVFVSFPLAPGVEEWGALNRIRNLIQPYADDDDWKLAGPYWTCMEVWKGLASEVLKCGRSFLSSVGDLIYRLNFIANRERFILEVGSVWFFP